MWLLTAAQIPDIAGRKYPKELAGEDLYQMEFQFMIKRS